MTKVVTSRRRVSDGLVHVDRVSACGREQGTLAGAREVEGQEPSERTVEETIASAMRAWIQPGITIFQLLNVIKSKSATNSTNQLNCSVQKVGFSQAFLAWEHKIHVRIIEGNNRCTIRENQDGCKKKEEKVVPLRLELGSRDSGEHVLSPTHN